jgi:APA family basic amino acid/polyamine antiporter
MLTAVGLIIFKRRKLITGKIPGYPLAPILFILFTTIFLIGVLIGNPTQSLAGTALLFSGVPFYYFFRKRKRSEI